MTGEQLPLPFPKHARMGRAEFHSAPCNAAALHLVCHVADWPHPVAAITGPDGAGKSHLGRIFAERAHAVIRPMGDIRLEQYGQWANLPLLIEQGGPPPDEEALFHLFNRPQPTLILSASLPGTWAVGLADLRSRLQSLPVVEVTLPDDGTLLALLAKLFADRHATPDPEVLRYMVSRMERSYSAALKLADALCDLALRRGAALNRGLVREVLDSQLAPELPL